MQNEQNIEIKQKKRKPQKFREISEKQNISHIKTKEKIDNNISFSYTILPIIFFVLTYIVTFELTALYILNYFSAITALVSGISFGVLFVIAFSYITERIGLEKIKKFTVQEKIGLFLTLSTIWVLMQIIIELAFRF